MVTGTLTDRELLREVTTAGAAQNRLNVERARVAGELASREDVVRAAGHKRAALMLAELWQITTAEAQRLVDVGLATRPRVAIDGSELPARFEAVAEALETIGIDKASLAVRELDKADCSFEARVEAETALVAHAPGFTVTDFAVLARQVRDRLDQDGALPRDAQHQKNRSLRITQLSGGMTRLVWEMPPVTAGLVRAGIDAIVSAQLRHARDEARAGTGVEEDRSFEQLRSDAAEDIFRHAATCGHTGGDLPAFTVVVRMTRDTLVSGAAVAEIDGVSERDGGCAFPGCSSPPAYADAHHIRWWSHGGLTHLSNGVMLCSFHHHRIHHDGWEIEIRDNLPWVIPPPWIDPARTPRRGGRVASSFAVRDRTHEGRT